MLSGFWHGANWTFLLWGAYHALLFVPLLLLNQNRRYRDTVATTTLPDGTTQTKLLPSIKESFQMLITFALVVFGWIIFRATGMKTLTTWMTGMFDSTLFSIPWLMNRHFYIPLAIAIFLMLLVEWINRKQAHGLDKLPNSSIVRTIIYYIVFTFIFLYSGSNETFIYFQF